jgi:hypothetical protein
VHHVFQAVSMKREQILDRGRVARRGAFQEQRREIAIGCHVLPLPL